MVTKKCNKEEGSKGCTRSIVLASLRFFLTVKDNSRTKIKWLLRTPDIMNLLGIIVLLACICIYCVYNTNGKLIFILYKVLVQYGVEVSVYRYINFEEPMRLFFHYSLARKVGIGEDFTVLMTSYSGFNKKLCIIVESPVCCKLLMF